VQNSTDGFASPPNDSGTHPSVESRQSSIRIALCQEGPSIQSRNFRRRTTHDQEDVQIRRDRSCLPGGRRTFFRIGEMPNLNRMVTGGVILPASALTQIAVAHRVEALSQSVVVHDSSEARLAVESGVFRDISLVRCGPSHPYNRTHSCIARRFAGTSRENTFCTVQQ
jgi:hypothetical protein